MYCVLLNYLSNTWLLQNIPFMLLHVHFMVILTNLNLAVAIVQPFE